MQKQFPFILIAVSVVLFFGPFPAYIYLIIPYTEGTQDPDAIQAVAWFSGIILMLVGLLVAPVALGTLLHFRRQQE
jgi:hypothetical protein